MDQQIDAIIDEAINEAIGTSSKKWALVLVALVVGGDGRALAGRSSSIHRPGASDKGRRLDLTHPPRRRRDHHRTHPVGSRRRAECRSRPRDPLTWGYSQKRPLTR